MSRADRARKFFGLDIAKKEDIAFYHYADGGAVPAPSVDYVVGSESRDAADYVPAHVIEEVMNARTEPLADPPVVMAVSNPGTGLRMFQALERSSYLRMAAMPYTPPGSDKQALIVSNGRRMWTADPTTFDPILVPLSQGFEQLSTQDNWSPVVGSEKGLRLG